MIKYCLLHNKRNCSKHKAIKKYRASKIKIVYGYDWHTNSDNLVLIKDEIDKIIEEVNHQYPEIKINFQLLGGKGGSIYCDICYQIQKSTIAIFDLSKNNLNVIFELGLAIGSGSYIFVLKSKHYPRSAKELSDLNGILEYRFSRKSGRIKFQSNFQKSFRSKLIVAIKKIINNP